MKTHEQIFRAASAALSGPRPGTGHRLLYLSLLLLAFSTNCGVLQGAVPILGQFFPGTSGKMNKQSELLVEVQESLLRFADEYSMRMVSGVDNLRRGADALSPAEVLELKIAIGSETWFIASSPNAVADLNRHQIHYLKRSVSSLVSKPIWYLGIIFPCIRPSRPIKLC